MWGRRLKNCNKLSKAKSFANNKGLMCFDNIEDRLGLGGLVKAICKLSRKVEFGSEDC